MNPKNFEIPDCETCSVKNHSIFAVLQKDDLHEISFNKGCSFYKRGQAIFQEGSRPIGAFCINSGKVKVSKIGDEGREQIVRLSKKGDVVGYRALISGENYTASATALDDCVICQIPKSIFHEILRKNPELSLKVMQLLSHDLKESEKKMADLVQKPVRERLAQALLMLAEIYGYENDNKTLDVILSREDVANIAGTATETIIRLLSDFNKEKLIALTGKKIQLLDKNKLVRTANVFD